jgi:hypothetical protein
MHGEKREDEFFHDGMVGNHGLRRSRGLPVPLPGGTSEVMIELSPWPDSAGSREATRKCLKFRTGSKAYGEFGISEPKILVASSVVDI